MYSNTKYNVSFSRITCNASFNFSSELHLFQLDHIGMRQFLEAFDLPEIHGLFPGVIFSFHPFNGDLVNKL